MLSDRAEIADVLVRYTRAIDLGDWDRLDTVFTPDADIDYVASGGVHDTFAVVKPWLAEVLPAFFPLRMHTLGQIDITWPDGGDARPDTAEVTAYFHNPMPMDDGQGGQKIVEIGGLYHHEMVRTSDGWRSRRLVEEVVWKRGL
jgi:hypothetical protein